MLSEIPAGEAQIKNYIEKALLPGNEKIKIKLQSEKEDVLSIES